MLLDPVPVTYSMDRVFDEYFKSGESIQREEERYDRPRSPDTVKGPQRYP